MTADGAAQPGPLTLEALETLAWGLLDEGWQRIHEPFYLGTLSSLGPGNRPTSRLMVVREVTPARRTLATHTDLRAGKVDGIRRQPATSWVFYDHRRFIQVLLEGVTTVHAGDDPLVRPQWLALPPGDRVCYREAQPSTTMAQDRLVGRPSLYDFAFVDGRGPDAAPAAADADAAADTEQGYAHFGVLLTRVTSLEIQYLGPGYQYRARVDYPADGDGNEDGGTNAAQVPRRAWLTV